MYYSNEQTRHTGGWTTGLVGISTGLASGTAAMGLGAKRTSVVVSVRLTSRVGNSSSLTDLEIGTGIGEGRVVSGADTEANSTTGLGLRTLLDDDKEPRITLSCAKVALFLLLFFSGGPSWNDVGGVSGGVTRPVCSGGVDLLSSFASGVCSTKL